MRGKSPGTTIWPLNFSHLESKLTSVVPLCHFNEIIVAIQADRPHEKINIWRRPLCHPADEKGTKASLPRFQWIDIKFHDFSIPRCDMEGSGLKRQIGRCCSRGEFETIQRNTMEEVSLTRSLEILILSRKKIRE